MLPEEIQNTIDIQGIKNIIKEDKSINKDTIKNIIKNDKFDELNKNHFYKLEELDKINRTQFENIHKLHTNIKVQIKTYIDKKIEIIDQLKNNEFPNDWEKCCDINENLIHGEEFQTYLNKYKDYIDYYEILKQK